ncbi:MAG TPA: hypothetical protein VGO93_08390 [Candidatus Xenobia bacterium]|jgi:hypothetical protein
MSDQQMQAEQRWKEQYAQRTAVGGDDRHWQRAWCSEPSRN